MDISANSKEGKVSAIEPSTSYIPWLHEMLAWYDDGTARQDRTVKPQFDNAKQQPPRLGGSLYYQTLAAPPASVAWPNVACG